MPRYFFDIVDDNGVIPDEEGSELPGPDAALEEAKLDARDMLADAMRARKTIDGRCFNIRDEAGEVVGTLLFRDLLS